MIRNVVSRYLCMLCLVGGLTGSVPVDCVGMVQRFVEDVIYDPVVVRGGIDETSPLFIYEKVSPYAQLVDSATVLFLGGTARLIYANLLTGRGWEVGGSGDGPGQFRSSPFFSEGGGFIYTVTTNAQTATFDRSGELIGTGRHAEPVWEFATRRPIGILDAGVVVTHYTERPDRSLGDQELDQAIVAYTPQSGVLWEVPLPKGQYISGPITPERFQERLQGPSTGVAFGVRHSTIAWARGIDSAVVVLNADGSMRGRIPLGNEPLDVLVDAEERIWVAVWTTGITEGGRRSGRYQVYDRSLRPIMTLRPEQRVLDAWGDYVLGFSIDESGLQLLHLLKRRAG